MLKNPSRFSVVCCRSDRGKNSFECFLRNLCIEKSKSDISDHLTPAMFLETNQLCHIHDILWPIFGALTLQSICKSPHFNSTAYRLFLSTMFNITPKGIDIFPHKTLHLDLFANQIIYSWNFIHLHKTMKSFLRF